MRAILRVNLHYLRVILNAVTVFIIQSFAFHGQAVSLIWSIGLILIFKCQQAMLYCGFDIISNKGTFEDKPITSHKVLAENQSSPIV